MKKNTIIILLLVLFTIPAVAGLLHKGFFESDDGEWMIIRFSAFYQTLREGQFHPRFLQRLNFEYGYPVANFLYPGFMYLGAPIHLLGFGFVNTIKLILWLSMVSSAIFVFLWLSKIFNKWAAVLGSIVYVYTPYHLYDLYKRGSVGEVLSLAVLPFILWQIEKKSLFWSSIGVAFLILSHNTLSFLFLPLIIVYAVIRSFKKNHIKLTIRNSLSMILFGVGLSIFFWFPALFDLQYTKFSQTTVSNPQEYFVNLSLIGYSSIVILTLALFSLFKGRPLSRANLVITGLFLLISLEGIFLALPISSLLWNILPIKFIQFPFRFLSLSLIGLSFLSAFIIHQSKEYAKIFLSVVIVILLAISAFPYLSLSKFFDKGDSFYATNEDTTTVKNEYMPRWVQEQPTQRPSSPVEPQSLISNFSGNSNNFSFKVAFNKNTTIAVQKVYFPGWKASIDGKVTKIQYENPKGLIIIPVAAGEHIVHVFFEEGGLRVIADIVSFATFIGLIIYIILNKRNSPKVR